MRDTLRAAFPLPGMRTILTKRTALRALAALALAGCGLAVGGARAAATKLDQTITVIVHAPAAATYDEAFSVAATSSSGLPVVYSAGGSCSHAGSGATFTMTSGTGTCLVKFDQPGDAAYNAAPQVIESVAARKADQQITFDALDDATFGDPDFDVGAFASSDLDVTFGASGKCTLSGVTVHVTGAGSCTLTAAQAGDDNFNAAPPVSQSFDIAKADQEITFDPIEDKAYGDPDFTVRATADSGLAVTFTAKGNCTVRGTRVHLTGLGSCRLTASQRGNANYNAAEAVSQTFAIARPLCSVPKVIGKTLAAARLAIARAHCRTGTVSYARSRQAAKGRVVAQGRRPGRVLPFNARVSLVIGRGR
jgi:hypothetical protein